jgi:multidrug efflux pump
MPPMEAACKGATQIGFTIISLTVSLIAVLIPLLFMGDVVGRLFREFAVTLAITILISAVVSLTLVPMMSARWLKHEKKRMPARPRRAHAALLRRRDPPLRPLAALGAQAPGRSRCWWRWDAGADGAAVPADPQGPVPDAGHRPAAGRVETAQSVSYDRMARLQQAAAKPCWKTPTSRTLSSFIGVDAANNTMLHTGRMLINLKATAASRKP